MTDHEHKIVRLQAALEYCLRIMSDDLLDGAVSWSMATAYYEHALPNEALTLNELWNLLELDKDAEAEAWLKRYAGHDSIYL